MKFAEYVAWIVLFMHYQFGEKIPEMLNFSKGLLFWCALYIPITKPTSRELW